MNEYQWISIPCGPHPTQSARFEFTKWLHVQAGVMYGANGHRMHWSPTNFPDGTYDPVSLMLVDAIENTPNFSRLALDFKSWSTFKIGERPLREIGYPLPNGYSKSKSAKLNVLDITNKCTVNLAYVKDAIQGDRETRLYYNNAVSGVCGETSLGSFRITFIRNRTIE